MAADATEVDDGAVDGEEEAMTKEFRALVPPEADFHVRFSSKLGRYMVSAKPLPAGFEFLIEAPLLAWPMTTQCAAHPADPAEESAAAEPPDDRPWRWCERCFAPLPGTATAEVDSDACERRVRRRISQNGPPGVAESQPDLLFCEGCTGPGSEQLAPFFSAALLKRWRLWQLERSAESCVGLEAFARCFAQVAATAARARAALNLAPSEALEAALRPFDRLIGPPEGASVVLHGTSPEEISAELRSTERFRAGVAAAVGCPELTEQLLCPASVEVLAGRLLQNAIGISVPLPEGGLVWRGGALYVLLSLMNHACSPSVEAVHSANSEVSLRTTRAVKAGEPLTLAYVSGDQPLSERREKLKHWFFECDCQLCEMEGRVTGALESNENPTPT